MEYHCMHQPFLPKYGVFVCVFSWKRAGEISLKYAEHRNAPADGLDYCLNDTLFWLKSISMHEPDVLDRANIKNDILVGTHSHHNSCGLTSTQKETIIKYYKEAIKKHIDIYACVRLEVDEIGAISVENRDDLDDGSIGKLKHSLIATSQEVISQCFPQQLTVYFWCWLKEKSDQFEQTRHPPYDRLSNCHIDTCGKYRSVYPKHEVEEMMNMFRNMGGIFLVNSEESAATDHYVFFEIQFLLDLIKDIITVDEKKKQDRLMAEEWEQLNVAGKAGKELLQLHGA